MQKPIKIKLNNGTAKGMYILLDQDEIKYTKENETKPPNRKYTIQIAVEAMYNHKRCRGKKNYSIPKGTAIIKAVQGLLGNRAILINTLKEKGTLKQDTIELKDIDTSDRRLKARWEAYIEAKKVNTRPTTIDNYINAFKHLKKLEKKEIENINKDDIQKAINTMLEKKKAPSTVRLTMAILRGIYKRENLIMPKVELPHINNERKFNGNLEDFKKIVEALKNYPHKEANAIFKFSLIGRRVSEIVNLRYEDIDWKTKMIHIPANRSKNKKPIDFHLLPQLEFAINSMGKVKKEGKIFNLHRVTVLEHFKRAMRSIGIHNMVLHDLRSALAQTALNEGTPIEQVSAMLGHTSTKITQKAYVAINKPEIAIKAQNRLIAISGMDEDIIDAEVLTDNFTAIKNMYPDADDSVIRYVMDVLEKKVLKS